MRLIDADSLKEKLCILGEHRIERLVEKEPTVDVLDKIRAEILALPTDTWNMVRRTRVFEIIDKYK